MNHGSEESPMTPRKAVEDVGKQQLDSVKKAKKSCGVLELHGHPMPHDEDQVLHDAWHRNEVREKGKGGREKEIERVECKNQSNRIS